MRKRRNPFSGSGLERLFSRNRKLVGSTSSVAESIQDGPGSLEEVVERYEQKLLSCRQLIEIGKTLHSTMEFPNLIDTVVTICSVMLKVPKTAILARRDIEATEFVLQRNVQGFRLDHSGEYSIPERHPLIRIFSRESRCYTMEEIESMGMDRTGIDCLRRLRPELVIPMRGKGAVTGILLLGSRGGNYTDDDIEFFGTLASFAGTALYNTLMFENTTTDVITKLKLRHFFQTSLIERLEESMETGRPLCVIMLDIDHFRRLNETYGSTCGDAVIRDIAVSVMRTIRGDDLASRFGDDEFAILLPGTDLDTAGTVADRIRAAVEHRTLEFEDYEIRTTVSLGVAQYDPSRDSTTRTLLERAERALSFSKRNGRNMVSAV